MGKELLGFTKSHIIKCRKLGIPDFKIFFQQDSLKDSFLIKFKDNTKSLKVWITPQGVAKTSEDAWSIMRPIFLYYVQRAISSSDKIAYRLCIEYGNIYIYNDLDPNCAIQVYQDTDNGLEAAIIYVLGESDL